MHLKINRCYNRVMRTSRRLRTYQLGILTLIGMTFPIIVEIILKFLLANNILSPEISSIIKFLRDIFPNKEILWTAYTGILTGGSVLIALLQPMIIREREKREYKESVIHSLKSELLTNWDYLSSKNIEIQISRNAYTLFIKDSSLFRTDIEKETIESLNRLYNLFSVFEYQRDYFYDKKYSFGKKEVGDKILMRDLAITTFSKRYECLIKLTSFILNLPEKEEAELLSHCDGLIEETLPRALENVKNKYKEKVKKASLKKLTIN